MRRRSSSRWSSPSGPSAQSAAIRGWDLEGVDILDIHPGLSDDGFTPEGQYTIFHPADVELAPVTRKITEAMDRLKPGAGRLR